MLMRAVLREKLTSLIFGHTPLALPQAGRQQYKNLSSRFGKSLDSCDGETTFFPLPRITRLGLVVILVGTKLPGEVHMIGLIGPYNPAKACKTGKLDGPGNGRRGRSSDQHAGALTEQERPLFPPSVVRAGSTTAVSRAERVGGNRTTDRCRRGISSTHGF